MTCRTPFSPSAIPYTLQRIEGVRADKTVIDPEGRFRSHPKGAAWIQAFYGPDDTDVWGWDNPHHSWRNVPAKILSEVFTFEECVRIWFGSVIMSDLGEWIEKEHFLLWKISNSHWRYGFSERDWNLMVDHLEGLKRLSTDIPGFQLRLTHSTAFNEMGWSHHEIDGRRIYIDGTFGLLLYYKGKHVLTVGFSPSKSGILIAQAQLRQPKGNRFLYHLPQHYLDVSIDILAKAFGKDKLCLVTGESTAKTIVSVYGINPGNDQTEKGPSTEALLRLTALYNRPLANFTRGRSVGEWFGRRFLRLKTKQQIERAA